MNSTIVADLCIRDLAAENAYLRERLASVEADRDIYAELTKRSIHVLHDVTADRDRLKRRLHQLLDQYRNERLDRQAAA